ncbi:MAG: hypothetical protein OXN94_03005 [Chloroflexota bacterium]|nr:hypothetical protein [Chloroflexota bacterium]MDE2856797.1 hypothetical protein [Chloroflexota bacterium]
MSESIRIDLARLGDGLPGVSKRRGGEHYEAAIICLTSQSHVSGVKCKVKDLEETRSELELRWSEQVTTQVENSWNDLEEATEKGAAGIAILVILELTEYTILRRAEKDTGIDYWLAYQRDVKDLGENVLKHAARLEVSGILEQNPNNTIRRRVKRKLEQSKFSDKTRLPAYVLVAEFSIPEVCMVSREVS